MLNWGKKISKVKFSDNDLNRLVRTWVDFVNGPDFTSMTEEEQQRVIYFALPASFMVCSLLKAMDDIHDKRQIESLNKMWNGKG